MPIAIALDTSSTRTGYVRGATDGSAPLTISSFTLPKEATGDLGHKLSSFREQLIPRLKDVEIIFMEEPILPRAIANIKVLMPLYSIAGMVELIAYEMKIPCYGVDNGKHKKLFYGKGGAKPENPEELASAWGFDAKNADEADACGVFIYSISKAFKADFKHWLNIKSKSPNIQFIKKLPKNKVKKKVLI